MSTEMVPPTGWADVATKGNLEHLEARLDQRIDMVRLEVRAEIAAMERRIIQWNVATLLTALAAFTAIVRLT